MDRFQSTKPSRAAWRKRRDALVAKLMAANPLLLRSEARLQARKTLGPEPRDETKV